ncbi:MAG: DUF1295 domain-containing protein [Solirubrobacteraceae bacterium]
MTSTVMLASAAGALALVIAVWLASLALRDASIIDSFWGVGFIVIAWVCVALGHGDRDRRLLLAILVTLWGTRLAVHITHRNHGRGEDPRYVAMRERDGARFWLTSLYRVFLTQAATMWVISLPLQAAGSLGARRGLGVLDVIGTAVWLVGFVFEALGDHQLDRFKANPAGLIGLGAGIGAAWGLAGSALDTLILTRVSGKPILERDIETRRPGYRAYIENTSGFFPLPPRRQRAQRR